MTPHPLSKGRRTITLAAITSVGIVSAWSTFYHAHQHQNQASHQRSQFLAHRQHQNTHIGRRLLHGELYSSLNDADEGEVADADSGERKRKRDILKRTLGLGGSNSGDSNSNEPVKLNTDNLFKGMPGVDSILGTPTSPVSGMPDMSSSSSASGSGGSTNSPNIIYQDDNDNSDNFQTAGQKKDPDLLSPEDIAALDSKYDSIKYQSEELVSNELSKGSSGEFGKAIDDNDVTLGSEGEGQNVMNITSEEARKIVDYAVQEEKMTEVREMNQQKKRQLIESWEQEGKAQEELIDKDLQSSPDGGETILQKDGVVGEIIQNAEARETQTNEAKKQKQELDFYERQLQQRKEIEGVVEKAAAKLGSDADIDDVYEEALTQIQSSRKEKLGAKSLGVYANSIALEEGREYVREQKLNKEFLRDVEKEAGLMDKSDDEVEQFFKTPTNYEEERIYRSIVRRLVDKRPEMEPAAVASTSSNDDSEEDDGEDAAVPVLVEDVKAKYTLSAKETVEAYKLLNLWREMQSSQDEMEIALGMKDISTGAKMPTPPSNKLEPFFLYEEDSEEKRQKERENLMKVLAKGLESDDDVENSSNEILMKELFSDGSKEGGVNKNQATRLLDKLLKKSTAGSTIRSSLEELKRTILEEDDTSVADASDEILFRKKKSGGGPVDLSGVFRTSDMAEEEEPKTPTFASRPVESMDGGSDRTMPNWVDEQKKQQEEVAPSPLPNTSFFQSEETSAGPPPSTPFFQSDEVEIQSDAGPKDVVLGTYEEQKLQQLANKVGASTEKEIEELRRNMEDLKKAEEMANLQLSDDDFDLEAASAKLGIEIGSVNLDDDSDDQIMSILGKRPVASSATTDTTGGTSDQQRKVILEFNEEESDDIIVDAEGHLKKMEVSEEQKRDIADDIFRAKTAGKYTDKAKRDSDEAAFKDFLKMEEEAEKKLDMASDESLSTGQDIDDIEAYADDIMSEIKPRPQVARREDFMSQEDILKERKQESIFGDDPFPTKTDSASASSSYESDMPEWFRKEQEDLGVKVEDLDEDDMDEARREWEREERQRKADEYLKKRGEGISISDVLGREYFGPMDEPDDMYDKQSAFDSFSARKELLLGYTELTIEDINNVMDNKNDPLATGYNPNLARVQRPFSEYGAIFRLEGVLSDLVGLHVGAWKAVAEKYGYQIQSSDEVRQASLYKPDYAVREVFYWTEDIFELKDIAETHQAVFNEAFDQWLEAGSVAVNESEDDRDALVLPSAASAPPQTTPSDEEMNTMYYLAWSKLANNLDKTAPTNDEVYRGIAGGDWEVAVKDIFGWTDHPDEVYDIVVAYDEILQDDYKRLLEKYDIDLDKLDAEQDESEFGRFPAVSLKEGVTEWLDTLQDVEMPCAVVSHLDSDQLDAVLTATGLAEYFPPDKRVSSDSGYSSERSEILGAALRVEQHPDKCVIFDNTPHSANEAHEVHMKSVSLVDHYVRYELLTADLSVAYARDLDLISFTKLFDVRSDLEPIPELDVNSGMQKQTRKVQTAFWDE